MKLVSFLKPGQLAGYSYFDRSNIRIGLIPEDGKVLDLNASLDHLGMQDEAKLNDMTFWIAAQERTLPCAEKALAAFKEGQLPQDCVFEESDIQLIAPVPFPTSCRDGYAFRQHVEAARRNRGVPMIPEFDEFPIFYFTNHNAISGPGEIEIQKEALEKLDFELEVAVVIGREGRNIPAAKADEYIFGYCIMNDWSARALQMREMKLNLGPAKGKDFSTTIGPYLLTRDELSDIAISSNEGERHDLRMRCWLNDELLSDGNTKDISYTFGQIIERISYGTTVYPGDVIGSGTVGTGCLLELNGSKITDNLWVKPGDTVTMEIERLGRLSNKVIESSEGNGIRV